MAQAIEWKFMNQPQGPNIAEWQAQQQHKKEFTGKKSGFGLGHGDSIATILDAMKWIFNFHEGVIAAYSNVFESLINGSSLVTLFGKSGNMFGIEFFESLAEYFSCDGRECILPEGMDNMDHGDVVYQMDDYPHFNNYIAQTAHGLSDVHGAGDYHGLSSFSPCPSQPFWDGHELSY